MSFEEEREDSEWISLSDLMSGLMMIFLFISVVFMMYQQKANETVKAQKKRLEEEKKLIRKIAVAFKETKEAIYKKLKKDFSRDENMGLMTIRKKDLSISFHAPKGKGTLFFRQGRCKLPKPFREKLMTFFTVYLKTLLLPKFREQIKGLHIEGHSSPEGGYLTNLKLSQCRARAVSTFVMESLKLSKKEQRWLEAHVSVNGLSSSQLLKKKGCKGKDCVDFRRSRRVTFRLETLSEQKLVKILQALKSRSR